MAVIEEGLEQGADPVHIRRAARLPLGGNYAFSQSGRSVGQYTLMILNPCHARVEMDLMEWEPNNDDGNPSNFNMEGNNR
jgi:hypothetical protein